MNKLSIENKVKVVQCLVEGMSIRATSRITDVSKPTVLKILADVGRACWNFHDKKVVGVTSRRIQCDEIWSFVYSKEKNKPHDIENAGDVWTWTAIDADTKLIVGWHVGNRDADSANTFMHDIDSRLTRRVQLTTDGLNSYLVSNCFLILPECLDFTISIHLPHPPKKNTSFMLFLKSGNS